ncbi:MAG: hypothetical protein ACI9CQ_003905, partial [Saprospiraceae bacterium]
GHKNRKESRPLFSVFTHTERIKATERTPLIHKKNGAFSKRTVFLFLFNY